VRHDEHSIHAEKVTGQDESSQYVFSYASASISQDFHVAGLHPQKGKWVDARIHASDNRETLSRYSCEVSLPK
jgi:hypothetical protein